MILFERLLESSRLILLFIYRWIITLKINAHQLIAYWKSKGRNIINIDRTVSLTEVNVDQSNTFDADRVVGGATAPIRIEARTSHSTAIYYSNSVDSSQHSKGHKFTKTPFLRRSRLFSLLRRLSPRNFMDYCVIALNEASGSGSSNKFDLSTCNSPLWLLGREYHMPDDAEQLIEDVKSKLWITYRKNFPPLDENTRYTSDRGFGCMIRCGQMVLANALLYRNLGRDWRWSPKGLDANPPVYEKILRLFQDREDCLYSIHRIVRTGLHEGKSVGEWFGPNTIAQALKRLSLGYQKSDEELDKHILVSIDAALDNMVVIDETKSKFKMRVDAGDDVSQPLAGSLAAQEWSPGILFIQLRLGLAKINPLYFSALKKTFQFHNSLGIIGGRPNHALYLVGCTDDDIIYLDPHSTQQYVDLDEISRQNENEAHQGKEQGQEKRLQREQLQDAQQRPHINQSDTGASEESVESTTPDSTYHCSCPERMSIERLDPSLALCFYFDTEKNFDDWCSLSMDLLVKSEQAPMFEITQSRPTDWNVSLMTRTISKSSSDHEEEFEILS